MVERAAGLGEQLHLLAHPCLLLVELAGDDPVHREVRTLADGTERALGGVAQLLEICGRHESLARDGPRREDGRGVHVIAFVVAIEVAFVAGMRIVEREDARSEIDDRWFGHVGSRVRQ